MSSLLAQITSFLPIFLASPTMYAGMILIMSSTGHTRTRVFAAWVGAALTIAVLGAIAVSLGGAAARKPSTASGIIDLVLGTALILLVAWVIFRKKPKPEDQKQARPPEDPAAGPKFFKYAFYGVLLVVTNPTSLTAYFASAKLTVDSGLPASQQAAAVILAGLYFTLPVTIPLLLLLFAPALCRAFLNVAQNILARYGRYIVVVFLVAVGLNMIVKGVNILRG